MISDFDNGVHYVVCNLEHTARSLNDTYKGEGRAAVLDFIDAFTKTIRDAFEFEKDPDYKKKIR